MGHILLALPEIEQFHLFSRLARKLVAREHRVTVMTGDPVSFEFYCHQGLACIDLRPERPVEGRLVQLALPEFAAIDCRLRGIREPDGRVLRRATRRLQRFLPGLLRQFVQDRPDLITMYEGRSGLARMIHELAKRYSVPVMHMAPGMLPMTLQVDRDGIDGDASFARGTPQTYRRAPLDDEFLSAATGSWLGRAYPPPLARVGVTAPPLSRRLAASLQAGVRGDWRKAMDGIAAWQKAYTLRWPEPGPEANWPKPAFVTVLLQNPSDPRLRLDATWTSTPEQLVQSAWQAVQKVDPGLQLVVVPADRMEPPKKDLPQNVHVVQSHAAALAVTLGAAVVTGNHPLGLAAVLAGTPVLHVADAPYGLPGVTYRSDGTRLAQDLQTALQDVEQPTLRKRFLTRLLKEHHVWCPPNAPDSNGVAGLVQWIERAIDAPTSSQRMRYRPGPVWPLAVAKRH